MPKSEVRAYAESHGLTTAKKKDSQGICFIGHIDLKEFLMNELGKSAGSVALLPIDDGNMSLEQRMNLAPIVGRHEGSIFYTLGERMGGIVDNRLFRIYRNQTQVPPMYLVARNVSLNRLFISEDHNDRHLHTSTVIVENLVVTGGSNTDLTSMVDTSKKFQCQVRYQQTPIEIKKLALENDKLIVETAEPLWAVAPGQSLVVYEGNQVVGGGVVCATR
jgi:tRNA-specific 2-thiouridylase